MKQIASFVLLASGADISIINKCPSDRTKYVGIGATIFFTGVFAAFAAAYALFTVFDQLWVAIVFGVVWGLMIFNLDRYIVSSMRKEEKPLRELIAAFPRIILALIISIVIAKPLELKIFEREIEPELLIMEQQTFAQQEEEVRNRFKPMRSSSESEIEALKNEIKKKEEEFHVLQLMAQQEADGTGGSRQKNLGPIYLVKKKNADLAAASLADVHSRNLLRIRALEQIINRNDSATSVEIAAMERSKLHGLAARLEALSRLEAKSAAIWWANMFILLLFMVIECAPVLVKLISRKGPYDHLLRIEEHSFLCQETEAVAYASDAVKKRTSVLGETERMFVNKKLDAELL